MFRRISKFTRILAVGALTAGILGALVPVAHVSAIATVTTIVTPNPATAGSAAQYNVVFDIGGAAGNALVEDSGQIVITFPAGTTVPATIAAGSIIVQGTPTSGNGTNAVPPAPPLVNGRVVTITTPVAIAAAAVGVTVIFSQSAGIINPTLASAAYTVTVGTASNVTPEAALASTPYAIGRTLTLSPTSGIFGTSVTGTGRGFVAGSTATVWLDNGAGGGAADDGIVNGTETILGQATVGTDNTFTATFTALATSGFGAGGNQVNAKDGSGTAVAVATNPTFTVSQRVSVSPTSGNIGSTVTVTISAGTAADPVADVTMGGIIMGAACAAAATAALSGTGGATYVCAVPAGAPLGVQTVVADVTTGTDPTTTFTVTAAALVVTPATIVPNQSISISATGLAAATVATNAAGAAPAGPGTPPAHQVTGGVVGAITSNLTIGGLVVAGIYPINLDSSGNMVQQVTVPAAAPLTTAGTYEVMVTDDTGRIGTATLTVPSRTATLSPTSSARGTIVTASGGGFAANSQVTIAYPAGTILATVSTDASGNYSGTFTVPVGTPLGAVTTVTVASVLTASTATAAHTVPNAGIAVSPATASAGSNITVTGTNFPAFSVVTAVTIGGINAIPSPAPATNATGSVTLTVLVPQVPVGTNALVVTAGGATANVVLTITAAPQTVQDSLAPLGTNLVRVWGYDPAANAGAGGFKLYDPAAAVASDLSTLVAGQGYWVRVNTAQTVTLGSFSYTLSAGWNLIGWRG